MRNSTDELSVLSAACSAVYVPYFVVLGKKSPIFVETHLKITPFFSQ